MKDKRTPTEISGHNRRREIRARLPHLATVFTGRRTLGPCLIQDLSAGGLRLVTDGAIRKGALVTVMTDLPGKKAMVMRARVSHSQRLPGGETVVGLAFVQIEAGDLERIRVAVIRHLADNAPTLFFFDTAEDGRPKRIVLTDDGAPLVLPAVASAG